MNKKGIDMSFVVPILGFIVFFGGIGFILWGVKAEMIASEEVCPSLGMTDLGFSEGVGLHHCRRGNEIHFIKKTCDLITSLPPKYECKGIEVDIGDYRITN